MMPRCWAATRPRCLAKPGLKLGWICFGMFTRTLSAAAKLVSAFLQGFFLRDCLLCHL